MSLTEPSEGILYAPDEDSTSERRRAWRLSHVISVAAMALLLLLMIVGAWRWDHGTEIDRQRSVAFQEIKTGDPVGRVEQLMGEPDFINTRPSSSCGRASEQPTVPWGAECPRQLIYKFKQPLAPACFVVCLDGHDRVAWTSLYGSP